MRIILIILGFSIIISMLLFIGCVTPDLVTEQRKRNVIDRELVFAEAEALIPQPRPSNFPARRMLAKFVERQDSPDHPFYVYVLSDVGNIIGYYVAQAAPVNICAFLSSTEKVYGTLKLTAPSLDGIYYGGAGSSSGCDGWFLFDAATDALVIIYGAKLFVVDQPLRVEAQPILIQQEIVK